MRKLNNILFHVANILNFPLRLRQSHLQLSMSKLNLIPSLSFLLFNRFFFIRKNVISCDSGLFWRFRAGMNRNTGISRRIYPKSKRRNGFRSPSGNLISRGARGVLIMRRDGQDQKRFSSEKPRRWQSRRKIPEQGDWAKDAFLPTGWSHRQGRRGWRRVRRERTGCGERVESAKEGINTY